VPDAQIIGYYSRSVMAISEGRMMPVMVAVPLAAARAQAYLLAQTTTAALIEAATGAGAVCGALPPATVEALGRYGRDLGMALQLAADAADYEATGAAFRQGIITLPLIYAIDAGGSTLAERLDQASDEATLADALAEVRTRGGVARTRTEAREFARTATAHLEAIAASPARDALITIAQHVG